MKCKNLRLNILFVVLLIVGCGKSYESIEVTGQPDWYFEHGRIYLAFARNLVEEELPMLSHVHTREYKKRQVMLVNAKFGETLSQINKEIHDVGLEQYDDSWSINMSVGTPINKSALIRKHCALTNARHAPVQKELMVAFCDLNVLVINVDDGSLVKSIDLSRLEPFLPKDRMDWGLERLGDWFGINFIGEKHIAVFNRKEKIRYSQIILIDLENEEITEHSLPVLKGMDLLQVKKVRGVFQYLCVSSVFDDNGNRPIYIVSKDFEEYSKTKVIPDWKGFYLWVPEEKLIYSRSYMSDYVYGKEGIKIVKYDYAQEVVSKGFLPFE